MTGPLEAAQERGRLWKIFDSLIQSFVLPGLLQNDVWTSLLSGRSSRFSDYSTVKGADCAISCFEMLSFTIIFTRYFPG